MEWVETTGKTIEDAKDAALERLGVLEDDAEIEVLEEPKAGLFGRVRGEARVRARVRPTPVRQKLDRRDRRRGKESGESSGSTESREAAGGSPRGGRRGGGRSGGQNGAKAEASAPAGAAKEKPAGTAPARKPRQAANRPSEKSTSEENQVSAEQVGQEAVGFMEGLVSAFGLTGTVSLVQDGDDLEVQVHGEELGLLVGPRGATLQAVQDLVRVAAQRRLGDHDTRLRVDVGGYRERRTAALTRFAQQMADEVV